MSTLNELPNDVIKKHILVYLEAEFLYVCLFVCKRWRELLRDKKFVVMHRIKYVVSVRMLKWITNKNMHFTPMDYYLFQTVATQRGSILLLEYVTKLSTTIDEVVVKKAAKYGHLTMLKWMRWKKYKFYMSTFEEACEKGHLRIVKYLHSIGCFISLNACRIAYLNSRTDIVEYFIDNNLPIDCELRIIFQRRFTLYIVVIVIYIVIFIENEIRKRKEYQIVCTAMVYSLIQIQDKTQNKDNLLA